MRTLYERPNVRGLGIDTILNENGHDIATGKDRKLPIAPDKKSGFSEVRIWRGWEEPPLGNPPKDRWEVYAISSPKPAPNVVQPIPRKAKRRRTKKTPN